MTGARLAAMLLAALAALSLSCRNRYDTSGMSRSELEELALEVYGEGGYDNASLMLTELLFSYPGSSSVDMYLYYLGMSEAAQRMWADAVYYFERVTGEYPRSAWADDSAMEIARTWWRQRRDYRKDLTPALNARVALQDFFDEYPASALEEEAELLRDSIGTYLSRRALFVGRFYARREEFDAAILYYREALDDYGENSVRGRVLLAMADLYREMGNDYSAGRFYERAIEEGDLEGELLERAEQALGEL